MCEWCGCVSGVSGVSGVGVWVCEWYGYEWCG